MTKNKVNIMAKENIPKLETDECSCSSCDSLCCFAKRQETSEACLCRVCENSKTCISRDLKKTDLNERPTDISEIIANFNKTISTVCVYGPVKMNNTPLTKSKHSDLECKLKNKLEKIKRPELDPKSYIAINHNEITKISYKQSESLGGKLSAQVMDLPYKDFKQSLASCKRSDTSSLKASKLSMYDVFQKIKDVYKACSCKVCECIVGKSTRNELCKCKPCECGDCMSYLGKLRESDQSRLAKDTCSCKQFEKTLSTTASNFNDTHVCKCKPCDCIECVDYFLKPCHCKPCQCVECKSILVNQPIIVVPVTEDRHRNLCKCSPCECIECGHRHGLSSSLMHEMSTGTQREIHSHCGCEMCQNEACDSNGFNACKCEKHNNVISKPIEWDDHDFDLRTVILDNPAFPSNKNNHDTIAMFASLSNNYSNHTVNTKNCSCDDCECLVCSYKEDVINAIKSSQLFTPTKLQTNTQSVLNTRDICKCKPCQCQICNKYKKRNQTDCRKDCLCEICNPITCRNESKTSIYATKKQTNKAEFSCTVCKCAVCKKMVARRKREQVPTCMICKRCIHNENLTSISKSGFTSQNTSFSNKDSTLKMNLQQERFSIYRAFPTVDFPQKTITPTISSKNFGTIRQASMTDLNLKTSKCRPRCPKICDILKCDAYTQYKDQFKCVHKDNSIKYKVHRSYLSESSSVKTNSKSSSYYKDNGSVTPISSKNKSYESSCNSSDYNFPDYLVQFPKSTVETCLKDVMNLNRDKIIEVDRLKISANTRTRKSTKGKSSYINSNCYGNTIFGKQKLSQGFEDFTEGKKYSEPVECKLYSHKRFKRKVFKDVGTYTPLQECCKRKYNKKKQNRILCLRPDVVKKDVIFWFTKNQSTQTGECDSEYTSENISSIMINRYETKSTNHRNLKNPIELEEFHIARNVYNYNVSNQGNGITDNRFQLKYCDTSSIGYISNGKDIFNIDQNYKRIQKTLEDAKSFSSDLIKILEKYEKENNEFESISEKLKRSYKSILYRNKPALNVNNKNNHNINETEYELRQIHLESSSTEEKLSVQVFPKHMKDENSVAGQKVLQNVNTTDFTKVSSDNRYIIAVTPRENPNAINVSEQLKTIQDDTLMNNNREISKKHINSQNFNDTSKDSNTHKNGKMKINRKVHRKYCRLMKRSLIIVKRINVKNPYINNSIPNVRAMHETRSSLALETVVKENSEASASIKEVVVGHSIKINEATEMQSLEFKRVTRKLDTVFGSTKETSVSTCIDKKDQKIEIKKCVSEEIIANQTRNLKGKNPWPILKKHFNLVAKNTTKNKGICISSALKVDVKEAIQSISQQAKEKEETRKRGIGSQSNHEHTVTTQTVAFWNGFNTTTNKQPAIVEADVPTDYSNIFRKSKLELELQDPSNAVSLQTSLQKLDHFYKKIFSDHFIYTTTEDIERQIRDLLNMSVLQPIMKKLLNCDSPVNIIDIESRMPRIESSKSSCEALKASFLGVRRVSDHTVLVKWNLPREVTDVQGYELLVDGRAVQKVLGPSRRLAVITCLPHADKLLLTVRTLTGAAARAGHRPAASIVYRPRLK